MTSASLAAPVVAPAIRDARRLVVKVGSSSITAPQGGIDHYRLRALCRVVAERWLSGRQVVLVSSGAIAAGMTHLGLTRRPEDLATQQAAASAGQGSLVAAYSDAFGGHGLTVGQVLLTADDTQRRSHYVNASRTLERLLEMAVVPVVNENDTVATEEIRFGDNDRLAALVAHLINADALVLLSDIDALYDSHPGRPGSSRIPVVTGPGDLRDVDISTPGTWMGRGGMVTKVAAARMAATEGIPTLLTSAEQAANGLAGDDVGTLFVPTGSPRSAGLRWLAHASIAAGRLVLDPPTAAALARGGTGVGAAGVTRIEGVFRAGDPVDLCDPQGQVVARGLVGCDAGELATILGRWPDGTPTTHGQPTNGAAGRTVIAQDDLVVL